MTVDWNAVILAFVGVIGYGLKAVVDAIRARYDAAQAIKRQQESKEERLRRLIYEWREHAYAVRTIALGAGVKQSELPEKPTEDDV